MASAAANRPVCNENDTVVVRRCPVHKQQKDDKPKKKTVAYKNESPVRARFPLSFLSAYDKYWENRVLEESVNEDSNSDVTTSPGNTPLSMLSCSTPLETVTLACETAVESCQIPVSIDRRSDVGRRIP